MEQDLTQLAVIIRCDDSTGSDEVYCYVATEANTMIAVLCEVDLNKD